MGRNERALSLVLGAGLLLGGCETTKTVGSEIGGECRLTHTPVYAVRGKTKFDQEWIDDTTEALVRGCRQPRPRARPPALDSPPIALLEPPKKTKKHWWQWR